MAYIYMYSTKSTSMSVAAIGSSVQRVGQPNSASSIQLKTEHRPNTGQTPAMYNNIFRGLPASPQKLPVNRVPDIVKRMQRDTKSSSAKKGRWYKNENYVDPRTYSWKNLSLFSDYQSHMWTEGGGIKSEFKK